MLKLLIEMRKIKTSAVFGVAGLLTVVVAGVLTRLPGAYAVAPSVVINELMYNPQSNVDNDEFLELYNTTGSTIDLSGWCFTRGITLCFNSGTTLASHAYGVISPNAPRSLSTYGVTTIGTYTGKLDNGGERLTLVDATSQVVNDLTYDDVAPWPTTPDGGGPSLELKDPELDNTLATSWGASNGAPTPGVVNSIYSLALPSLSDLNTPQNVLPSDTPLITVHTTDADSVDLIYKVLFNAEQTIGMHDDGTNGDATAEDNIYSAVIPAQAAGQLVRYKVNAENQHGSAALPGSDDTINYQGYVVQNVGVTSQVPILQWFMEDEQRDEMIANHSFDDQEFDTVIAYGNTVFDNAKVHIKGGVKRVFPKKSFAFDLPKGHKLMIDGEMTRAVDEFHLDADYIDPSGTTVTVGWQIAKESGLDTQQVFKIRLQNNAAFYGVYTFLEEDDKSWRELFGYDKMSYHGTDSVKNDVVADPVYEIQLWREALLTPRTQARRDYAVDNSDIPNMINYAAFMAIIHNCEWTNGKNMIKAHDVLDTNRWKMLAHDIDCTMKTGWNGERQMNPMDVAGIFYPDDRFQFSALYEEPDFRQVYYRRLRTLADEYFATDRYMTMIQDLYQRIEPDVQLDAQKWFYPNAPQDALNQFTAQYNRTKQDMLVRFRYNNVVPARQSVNPVINIDAVNVNVNNHQEDFVKLKNNTNEAIDISNWYIEELNFTIPAGAAIAPNQEAYIPRHDMTFKNNHSGSYVLGQLKQNISSMGELTLRRANDSISDTESLTL